MNYHLYKCQPPHGRDGIALTRPVLGLEGQAPSFERGRPSANGEMSNGGCTTQQNARDTPCGEIRPMQYNV
jgi:hypothetical protein